METDGSGYALPLLFLHTYPFNPVNRFGNTSSPIRPSSHVRARLPAIRSPLSRTSTPPIVLKECQINSVFLAPWLLAIIDTAANRVKGVAGGLGGQVKHALRSE